MSQIYKHIFREHLLGIISFNFLIYRFRTIFQNKQPNSSTSDWANELYKIM